MNTAHRESNFNTRFAQTPTSLSTYTSLHDPSLRHFFESPQIQKHLLSTGQIDRSGRVVPASQMRKIRIIEREFADAEKRELLKEKEEADMRRIVQVKRHNALDKARLEERLMRVKEDRGIRKEIGAASREALGLGSSGGVSQKKKNSSTSGSSSRSKSSTSMVVKR